MKKAILIIQAFVLFVLFSSFQKKEEKTYPLTVKVRDLRNSKGVVQFALYNTEVNRGPAAITRHLEAAYREMWQRYCAG
jgi:uncharacterized protein (DUF2141 family)